MIKENLHLLALIEQIFIVKNSLDIFYNQKTYIAEILVKYNYVGISLHQPLHPL